MSRHKVSELEGALLDAAVAKAEGLVPIPHEPAGFFYWKDGRGFSASGWFDPSASWEQGGPIIERERIQINPCYRAVGFDQRAFDNEWSAYIPESREGTTEYGPNPLIASMRAYVASKFGEEVELP